MIKRVSRKKLDVNKYTECLNRSVNYRIYAEVFYLDALLDNNWDCYVLNDYEAIMPLPFVKKFGFKFIVQPIYCQQLGVFHQENFSKETFQRFEKKLHRNLVRAYAFNEENTEMFEPKGILRINQILDLQQEIQLDNKTKKNIKSFINKKVELKNNQNLEEILNFKKINSVHKIDISKLTILTNILLKKDKIELYSCYQNEILIAFSIFVKSKKRSIYLNSSANSLAKKLSAPTGLLYHQIKKKDKFQFLDFEGSEINSLNHFFKGFGAIEKFYTNYKNF